MEIDNFTAFILDTYTCITNAYAAQCGHAQPLPTALADGGYRHANGCPCDDCEPNDPRDDDGHDQRYQHDAKCDCDLCTDMAEAMADELAHLQIADGGQ